MIFHKLDSIGKRLASLVLCGLVALAVAGCGASTQQIIAQNNAQVELTKFAIAEETKREAKRMEENAKVLIAIESRKAEEAKAAIVEAGAMMKIAEKADAGGRAAIAVNMSHNSARRKIEGGRDKQPKLASAPAPIKLPELQPLKSHGEVAADMFKAALNSPVVPTVGQIALGVVQGNVQKAQARYSAETTQAMYTMFRGMNADTTGALRDTSGKAVDGLVALGMKPTIGNLVGDGNALFGGVATRNIKIDCPLGANLVGGDAGNGGNGAGGAAANAGGGAGGAGGSPAPGGQVNNINCTAGK